MNWDDLRLLSAAAEKRSLSAAARSLGISQPTASRRLRALEQNVGARLFDRLPEGLAPTPAGERLIPLVADMASAADAINRAKPQLPATASGTVRISVVETVGRILAQNMSAILNAIPAVEVEIITSHTEANLSRREADLLIRECLPDGSSLIARRLGDFGYAVYGARDYVAQHPAARREDRYRDCDWVGHSEDRFFWPVQKKWQAQHLTKPARLRSSELSVVMEGIRAGVGLGLAPCYLADGDPGLQRLTPVIAEVTACLNILVHRDVLREPAVRAVMDALIALFSSQRARLMGEEIPQTVSAAE